MCFSRTVHVQQPLLFLEHLVKWKLHDGTIRAQTVSNGLQSCTRRSSFYSATINVHTPLIYKWSCIRVSVRFLFFFFLKTYSTNEHQLNVSTLTSAGGFPPSDTHSSSSGAFSAVTTVSPCRIRGRSGATRTVSVAFLDRMAGSSRLPTPT